MTPFHTCTCVVSLVAMVDLCTILLEFCLTAKNGGLTSHKCVNITLKMWLLLQFYHNSHKLCVNLTSQLLQSKLNGIIALQPRWQICKCSLITGPTVLRRYREAHLWCTCQREVQTKVQLHDRTGNVCRRRRQHRLFCKGNSKKRSPEQVSYILFNADVLWYLYALSQLSIMF